MEFTGKTVEEATEKGLTELGITSEEAEIAVVSEAVKGLFGKIKKEAVVDVKKKVVTEKTKTVPKEKPADKPAEEKVFTKKADKNGKGIDEAAEFVTKLFGLMDVNAKANITDEKTITVIAEDSSEIIGYRGEVLDAIQVLAGAVANIGNKEYKKIVVDCENYRDRREETLIALAKKLEAKATEMRRKVILEPMSPFERRIIHTALSESETVKTESDGKEPSRYVVIIPNDLDETARPYNAGTNHGRNRKGGAGGKRNDRRGGRDQRGRGRGERRGSGFTEEKRKAPSGFGTYLGNSLKDKND